MQAILFSTEQSEGLSTLGPELSAEVHVLDRPAIHHVVELLVDAGVQTIHLVLGRRAHEVLSLVGDGARWGVEIRPHLVRNFDQPQLAAGRLGLEPNTPVLLGCCDQVPFRWVLASRTDQATSGAFLPGAEGMSWCGWARIDGSILRQIALTQSQDEIAEIIASSVERRAFLSKRAELLDLTSAEGVRRAQFSLLQDPDPDWFPLCRELKPGVWVSPHTRIASTARLKAPVYIGEDATIGPRATIGPNVIIGSGGYVDSEAHLYEAIVHRDTYISSGSTYENVLLRPGQVIEASAKSAAASADNRVRSLSPSGRRTWPQRSLGIALLALTSPVRLTREVLSRHPVSILSPNTDGKRLPDWHDFVHRFVPDLTKVARGDLDLVGVRPLSQREEQELPEYWSALRNGKRRGIIHPALVERCLHDKSQEFAAEALFCANDRASARWKLFAGYLRGVARSLLAPLKRLTPTPEGLDAR